MKYVIIRCEDRARGGPQTAALLEGAKTAHLQQLAQAGAAGTLRSPDQRTPLECPRLHRTLLGLEDGSSPGSWYAASANLTLGPGETAWCCELVTQQDGRILDPTAGDIPTKESELLIQAVESCLGSDVRRWVVGHGPHHVLIVRDPAFHAGDQPPIRSPELLVGEPWKRHLPRGRLGEVLAAVIDQAATVLEGHPVNRVRVDLGENPANLLWLWGGAAAPRRAAPQGVGPSGAVVSRSFLTRGLARVAGFEWLEGPAVLDDPSLRRALSAVETLLNRRDLIYVHLELATADPVERLCAMERIDQLLLKPLTESLPQRGPWRFLAVLDDRPRLQLPIVAIGTGLPQQPIAQLDAEHFAESPLVFPEGAGAFAWFTGS